jgi:uncharacterized membrane protein
MSENIKEPRKLTQEENEQINYLKKIVSASFAKLQTPSFIGLVALTELALVALALNAKSEQEYLEKIDIFYKDYMIPTAKATAAKTLAYFSLVKQCPEIIDEAMKNIDNDPSYKVVVLDSKEELDFVRMGTPGETTPTKH